MRNGDYELIVAPAGYPGKRYRDKYAYEHRVNWWLETGKNPDGTVIHHKDETKRNNTPDNLEAMTPGGHVRHHNLAKPTEPNHYTCLHCLQPFTRRKGIKPPKFCSRRCIGLYGHRLRVGRPVKKMQHGTYNCYATGCRCEPCRAAHSKHKRAYLERRKAREANIQR